MSNSFTRLEQLQYAYRDLLQQKIGAALADIAAFWAGQGDPITLPPIADWITGNVPEGGVRTLIKVWPTVTVEVTGIGPTQDRQPLMGLVDALFVTVYILGQTPQQADKLAHRYAAAIAQVIATERPEGVGVKGAGPIAVTVGEAEGFSRINYFKASQVASPLRIGINLKGY